MKRLIFVFAALICGVSASAQMFTEPVTSETSTGAGDRTVTTTATSKNVLTNDFKYNWEMMAALGTQFYYGDNDKYYNFWQRWTFPAIDLMFTKWASPIIGFSFGLEASSFKGLYQRLDGVGDPLGAHFQTDIEELPHFYTRMNRETMVDQSVDMYRQKGFYWNPFIAASVDVSNLLGGYKGDRFYTLQAYFGGGIVLAGDEPTNAHGVSFNTGLVNKFRLGERFDLVVNLRGAMISDDFDGESRFEEPTLTHVKKNVPWDGQAGVTAGLCYHFGVKKNLHTWTKADQSTTEHYVAPVTVPAPPVYVHDTVQVFRPVDPSLWFHIQFKVDKTDIQPRERINVNSVADFIKSAPDTKFLVTGFADKQTSTPEHNLWLSEHRAANVYNMLINDFGVNPAQLEVDYQGGVDYMFYTDEDLSRCVMIVPMEGKSIDEYGERHIN